MFHNNCFVKFKIFVSTVVFKFELSKDIQHGLLILVLLSNLQKFVGVFDFFLLIMFLKYKIIAVAIWLVAITAKSLVLSILVITYCKLLRLRLHHKVFAMGCLIRVESKTTALKKVSIGHNNIHLIFRLYIFLEFFTGFVDRVCLMIIVKKFSF